MPRVLKFHLELNNLLHFTRYKNDLGSPKYKIVDQAYIISVNPKTADQILTNLNSYRKTKLNCVNI